MKNLFLIVLSILIVFSQYITHARGRAAGNRAVLHWMTDPNPARLTQVKAFHAWLEKQGPRNFSIELDAENSGLQKTMIQGVSGVAGDLLTAGGMQIQYLEALGLLAPVGPDAPGRGSPFWEGVRPDLVFHGEWYGAPSSLGPQFLLVNEEAFASNGLPVPPFSMDFKDFEDRGREFVARANRTKPAHRVFFTDTLDWLVLLRSAGVSLLDETLSGAAVDRPEAAEVLATLRRWTIEEHLLPSAAELQSFTVDQGYGGASFQLLRSGQFAMIYSGRQAVIQLRRMGPGPRLGGSLSPWLRKPTALVGCFSIGVYRGSGHKEAARRFLDFRASDEYNRLIVEDGDGLPPVVRHLESPEFLRPVGRTNEWGLHQASRRALLEYGVTREYSPFATTLQWSRKLGKLYAAYNSGIADAPTTVREMARAIEAEIQDSLRKSPEKRASWESARRRQREIDAIKASGRLPDPEMIDNPFLRAYRRGATR